MESFDFKYPKFDELNPSNCREVSIQIHYPKFYDYLLKRFFKQKVTFAEKLYMFYHNMDHPSTCRICGNPVMFLGYKNGYREFCSHKCADSCPDVQKRKKETSLKNYGIENPMLVKEVRDKQKKTCLEKYGVENCFQSKELMQKARQTCLKKYGTEYAIQSEEIKEKLKQSIQQKVKEKYNNIISIEPGNLEDNGDTYIMKCIDPNCDKCINKTFKIKSGVLYDRIRLNVDICTNRTPIGSHIKNTIIEKFIKNILDNNNIEYETSNRKILKGKELDIYIPSKNIAIECNGVYWHSMLDSSYHYNKWKSCQEQGIQLLSIWEDWITNKSRIVEGIVLSKLGIYKKRIGARDCEFGLVSSTDARKFLNENHIQGFCTSTVRYGLYYNKELVSIMCFKKVNNPSSQHNEGWELLRFCTKLDMQIVGGAERLLTHFREDHKEPITSFASHDISNGNLYEKLGFQYINEIRSCYWYVHNKTHQRFHRSSFTKKNLVKQGYDPSLTEEQIMMSTDYLKIYDSGLTKYVLS